jgi:hypothetical protein
VYTCFKAASTGALTQGFFRGLLAVRLQQHIRGAASGQEKEGDDGDQQAGLALGGRGFLRFYSCFLAGQ